MGELNKEFNILYYILKYIELSSKGHYKCMEWWNIKVLLNLAVINNRLSKQ